MESKEYAERWEIDAKAYAKAGVYSQFAKKLGSFRNIIEIGCGTGESTLALLNEGHFVVAIDKNKDCVLMTRKKLLKNGFKEKEDFILITGDFFDRSVLNDLAKMKMDLIICWNPSSFLHKDEFENMFNLLKVNGYSEELLYSNFSSSYCEFLQFLVLRFAKSYSLSASLVDRTLIDSEIFKYFGELSKSFELKLIDTDSFFLEKLSSGGIQLSLKGKKPTNETMKGYLVFGLFSN